MTRRTDITILDGGMGRELKRMGAPFSQPLWSAQALLEDPDAVRQAHLNFTKAGADILTTNAYALVPHHMGADLYAQKHAELTALSARLAADAASGIKGRDIRVAGCVPPVFGSYRPDLFDADQAESLIAPFFKLQRDWCDLFLAETVSSMQELRAIKTVYDRHGGGKDLWVALTLDELAENLDDPLLRSGEKVQDVLSEIETDIQPAALLFNCCPIENILPALRIARQGLSETLPVGAYPNAFTNTPKPRTATITSTLRHDVTPAFYLTHAQSWTQTGATIIGGCCGIGPEHIETIANQL
ncbi:MAG: homocysteine S-methyltransferase family protein [Alphaproteobacteria bacterium]